MNPRFIMDVINKNHKIMQRRMETVQAAGPTVTEQLSKNFTLDEVMSATVSAQLQGAVELIAAMSETESRLPSSDLNDQKFENASHNGQTIEAEFKEIPNE